MCHVRCKGASRLGLPWALHGGLRLLLAGGGFLFRLAKTEHPQITSAIQKKTGALFKSPQPQRGTLKSGVFWGFWFLPLLAPQ
jgi:hypothetical protein